MDDIETAGRRMRAHPAFTGGPADEGYWLDSLQWALASNGTYEVMTNNYAARLEQKPRTGRLVCPCLSRESHVLGRTGSVRTRDVDQREERATHTNLMVDGCDNGGNQETAPWWKANSQEPNA